MGILKKLIGLSTAHEGQHQPGKHAKGSTKKPQLPPKGKAGNR